MYDVGFTINMNAIAGLILGGLYPFPINLGQCVLYTKKLPMRITNCFKFTDSTTSLYFVLILFNMEMRWPLTIVPCELNSSKQIWHNVQSNRKDYR